MSWIHGMHPTSWILVVNHPEVCDLSHNFLHLFMKLALRYNPLLENALLLLRPARHCGESQ